MMAHLEGIWGARHWMLGNRMPFSLPALAPLASSSSSSSSSSSFPLHPPQVVAENAGDTYIKLKLKDQLQSLTLLNEDPTLSKLKKVCVCVSDCVCGCQCACIWHACTCVMWAWGSAGSRECTLLEAAVPTTSSGVTWVHRRVLLKALILGPPNVHGLAGLRPHHRPGSARRARAHLLWQPGVAGRV